MAQSFNPGFDVATRSALQVAPEPVLTTGIGVATRWAITVGRHFQGVFFATPNPELNPELKPWALFCCPFGAETRIALEQRVEDIKRLRAVRKISRKAAKDRRARISKS
jgi:hypothetical protein